MRFSLGVRERGILFCCLVFLPLVANAHSVGKQVGDFYWGFMHPVVAMESVFPIIALGLLAGQSGAERARAMLVLFSIGLLIGAFVGLRFPESSIAPQVNLASFVILGLLLAAAVRLPVPLAAAIGLVSGLFQGWGNAADVAGGGNAFLFACGLLLASYLLVVSFAGVGVTFAEKGGWQAVAVRVAGSWIAAIGLMVFALQ